MFNLSWRISHVLFSETLCDQAVGAKTALEFFGICPLLSLRRVWTKEESTQPSSLSLYADLSRLIGRQQQSRIARKTRMQTELYIFFSSSKEIKLKLERKGMI